MRRLSLALLAAAALARLLLHEGSLPPYAGLDEAYHVARLAFARAEGRQPVIRENSLPPYIASSLANDPKYPPAFTELGPRWPEVVRARPVNIDPVLRASDLRPYVRPNYEAQQPSPYYAVAARLVPVSTPLRELRAWRLLSVFFALIVVMATALMGIRFFGDIGILAAALMVSFPTWHTLLVRASNDAMACAFLAVALAISASAPKRGIWEGLAWAGALATKLYTWPVFAAAMLFWWQQRAGKRRVLTVISICAIAVVLTVADLNARTRNPIGVFSFDPAHATGAAAPPIAVGDMVKITLASGVWTSGPHWNALTPIGMLLYFAPILVLLIRKDKIVWPTLAVFGLAQLVNAIAFIRQARAAGISLPLGGKEGWYWYAMLPLVAALLLAPALRRFRWLALWIVVWDVVISDAALLRDFAGATSPAHPSWLFRWGPLQWPEVTAWRVVHLALLAVLFLRLESLFARELIRDVDRHTAR